MKIGKNHFKKKLKRRRKKRNSKICNVNSMIKSIHLYVWSLSNINGLKFQLKCLGWILKVEYILLIRVPTKMWYRGRLTAKK